MSDDVVSFYKKDLPMEALPMMENIRRHAQLCDVTLKVSQNVAHFIFNNSNSGE